MSKRIIAVTSIVSDKFKVNAGEVLDISKFTREQLKELHGLGAIRIEEVVEVPKVTDLDDLEVSTSKVTEKPEVKATTTPEVKEPKTPETLVQNSTTKPEEVKVNKVTNPPVGRMTKENIAQVGANSSLNKGDSNGESKPK